MSKSFRLSPKYLAVIKVLPFVVIMSILFIGCIDFGQDKKAPQNPVNPQLIPPWSENTSPPTWSENISPLFNARCTPCHISQSQAGLNLATYESATANHRIINPGQPDSSDLVKRIEGILEPRMPFGGPYLDADTIKTVRDWISDGAQNN